MRTGHRARIAAALLAAPLLLLTAPVAGVADAAAPAATADDAFYTPPSPLPAGGHGTLIRQQAVSVTLAPVQPAVRATRFMYKTQDGLGADALATGTVMVPLAPWTGGGSRPVVDYGVATHGLDASCAPSKQLTAGADYEGANIAAALNRGWAVVATDYQGYTTGSKTLYLIAKAGARAILDAQLAAQATGQISAGAKTALWGFSQGGAATTTAAGLAKAYTPSLNIVGLAAGGVAADLLNAAQFLENRVGAGDVAMTIVGLDNQYPAINLAGLANDKGAAVLAKLKTQCVFDSILDYQDARIQDYTKSGQGLAELAKIPAVASAIADQTVVGSKLPFPVFQYHGQADEFVPIDQAITLKKQYCAAGTVDQFSLYPSEHIATQFQAAPAAVSWIADRFAGKTAPSSCAQTAPAPVSTANPAGGNFVVSLKSWPLNAKIDLKNLGGSIVVPPGATFTGDTDLTAKLLKNGQVASPTFTTTLQAFGAVPLQITVKLTQDGAAGGTASLDSAGQLHIAGSTKLTFNLTAIDFLGVHLVSSGCKTVTPVNFPLKFDGPVSSLGNGNLTLAGEATFPKLTNCGALTDVLNGLFPGPGNAFSFTISPPAPTAY